MRSGRVTKTAEGTTKCEGARHSGHERATCTLALCVARHARMQPRQKQWVQLGSTPNWRSPVSRHTWLGLGLGIRIRV